MLIWTVVTIIVFMDRYFVFCVFRIRFHSVKVKFCFQLLCVYMYVYSTLPGKAVPEM